MRNCESKLFFHGCRQKKYKVKFAWYTSMEILLAQRLGFKVSLIKKSLHVNCIKFDSFKGSDLFGNIIGILYEKKKNSEGKEREIAKCHLNSFLGKLGMREEHVVGVDVGQNEDCQNEAMQTELEIDEKTGEARELIFKNFKFPTLCQIPNFIYAYTRVMIANIILDNLDPDDIIYIHTDGFVSKSKLLLEKVHFDKSSDKLGDLKLEKTGKLIIKSGRKYFLEK